MKFAGYLLLLLGAIPLFSAPAPAGGSVTGSVLDKTTDKPAEYVTIALKKKADGTLVAKTATDSKGAFDLEGVPPGDYVLAYSYVGADGEETPPFTLESGHPARNLGQLVLASNAIKMEKFQVAERKDAFYNSIDRKVYNVGKDIQSLTGSASDLLSNIPSVQVDIEGTVTLRGSDSVLILIDGKTSTLMGPDRAAALEQMSADSIDKIEVITNPSAKYKPDGTAGIINIVRKKKRDPGYAGSFRFNLGNDHRYNGSLSGNYGAGKANFNGSLGLRQDDRLRFSQDNRSHVDPTTGRLITTEQRIEEHQRPLSRVAQAGVEYAIDKDNKVEVSGHYNNRTFTRTGTDVSRSKDDTGAVTSDYDRLRIDPEFERDLEFRGNYSHSFADEGHELNFDLKHGRTTEQEDNHYTTIFNLPAGPNTLDNTLIRNVDNGNEGSVEYLHPLADDAKLESGYSLEADRNDQTHLGTFVASNGALVTDPVVSNRFLYDSTIHSFYTTYGRPFGSFGILAGVRLEQAYIKSNQVTAHILNHNDYSHFFPSLHLSYNLTAASQLQLNYSHRVRRPESDDLNPYPEYQDPYNLRAGNPKLLPEETHSIEAGYQYKEKDTTYLATLYYRYRYNSMTEITRFIDPVTLLTTKENLGISRFGGIELAANTDLGSKLTLNSSANIYYNQIDASSLGFSATRSTVTWDGKVNLNYRYSKTTLVQLNTNYTARRLTPQGNRLPTYIANLGLRHDLKDKKMALILTASDLFNSLKERTIINTPALTREVTRRRSARIIYLGLIYNFGKPGKKAKDDLQFDDKL